VDKKDSKREAMEWISVEEKLPDPNVHVLTPDGEGLYWVCERWISEEHQQKEYFKSVICTCCNNEYEHANIKYWSYIEPPKEK